MGKTIIKILIFIILTVLSQIGGLIFLLSLYLSKKLKLVLYYQKVLSFSIIYLVFNQLVIPQLAPLFGREKIIKHKNIEDSSFISVIFNRNYVRPTLNIVLKETANELYKSGIKLKYLDANFPFINKFPLLPHLSHNDGRKIDLSLVYENKTGVFSSNIKSRSGYGVFEGPKNNEFNQINKCKNAGYWQYDYPKYLTLGQLNNDLEFSKKGTKILAETILKNEQIEKLFIEPHLMSRLNLSSSKIRFHGCGAVRHDDHIHVQVN